MLDEIELTELKKNNLQNFPLFAHLPSDIFNFICSFISAKDILNLRGTSQFFKKNVNVNINKLLLTKFKNKLIKQVVCGYQVSIFVTKDGSFSIHGKEYYKEGAPTETLQYELNNIRILKKERYDLPPVQKIALGRHHIMILCQDGSLWACGKNSEGELGFDPKLVKELDLFARVDFSNTFSIKDIFVGDTKTFLISKDGLVWFLGDLGNGSKYFKPVRLSNLPAIKQIISVRETTFYLCENGQLFIRNSETHKFSIIDLPPIKKMVFGYYHGMLLCEDNAVLYFNKYSNSNDLITYKIPLSGPIINIAMSESLVNIAMFLIRQDGSVYVFGESSSLFDGNYLGLGKWYWNKKPFFPRRISNLPPVEEIAVGAKHTIFQCKDKRVFVCGTNDGQLGVEHFVKKNDQVRNNHLYTPTPIPLFNKIVEICHYFDDSLKENQTPSTNSCRII